jgi:hypothetical protein
MGVGVDQPGQSGHAHSGDHLRGLLWRNLAGGLHCVDTIAANGDVIVWQ